MIEGQNIEWKEKWDDKYLAWISGFSNSNGGEIHIGRNDDGEIIGIRKIEDDLELIPNKIKDLLGIVCTVEECMENEISYIKIIVSPSSYPIAYRGKYYQRSGSSNMELKGVALANFVLTKSGASWESVIVKGATISDLDEDSIVKFIELAVNSNRLPNDTPKDIKHVLSSLNLMKGGELTRAALVLFGNDPTKFIPSCIFKVAHLSNDGIDIHSQELVATNVFNSIERITNLLRDKFISSSTVFEGLERKEILNYPLTAIREILFNAIAHREYNSSAIHISIYSNKISIWNPGILDSKLDIDDLRTEHPSYPRNDIIAQVLYRAGYIETWGTGTLKTIRECRRFNLFEPKFENFKGGFMVTLFTDDYTKELLEKYSLNERQIQAVLYLKSGSIISNSQYRSLYGVSRATSLRDLESMVEKGLLIQNGDGKATNYSLNMTGF